MKLHIENLESKFDYYNQLKKENKYLHEKIKKMEDTKKENEIIILKAENKNLKDILSKKEQEFDITVKKHSEEIAELNKKILNCEEALKFHNSKILLESDNDKSVNILISFLIKIKFFNCLIFYFHQRLIDPLILCIKDHIHLLRITMKRLTIHQEQ